MPRLSPASFILSLFCPFDKAQEIEGDLIEQSHRHGTLWFWLNVANTAGALLAQSIRSKLLIVFLCSWATYELAVKVWFYVLRPTYVFLISRVGTSAEFGVTAEVTMAMVILLVAGFALSRLLPRLGFQICLGTIACMILRMVVLQEGISADEAIKYAFAPMLAGCLLSHWLNLRPITEMST